jgi:hypothetical protein
MMDDAQMGNQEKVVTGSAFFCFKHSELNLCRNSCLTSMCLETEEPSDLHIP